MSTRTMANPTDPIVQPIPLPADSLAAHAFPKFDYADAFRVRISTRSDHSVDSIARALFSSVPVWVEFLLRLRNALVRPLGLRTALEPDTTPPNSELTPGSRVGIFRVFVRTADEVLMGDDDRHLDFRVSVRVEQEGSACWAVVTTVVRFHNRLGRTYFMPVRPFHRLIVPAVLKHGAGRRGA